MLINNGRTSSKVKFLFILKNYCYCWKKILFWIALFLQCSPSPPMQDASPLSAARQTSQQAVYDCHWLKCDKNFSSMDDLVTHVNDHHVKVERPDVDYQCKWNGCPRKGKGFNARYGKLYLYYVFNKIE